MAWKREKKPWERWYCRYGKRLLDCLFSGLALLVMWPVMLLIALAIVVEDGFPIIYRAPRGGYLGKPFQIWKFRTMVKDADRIGGGTTGLNDPRITKIGHVLRKTKLDELPQFGQVLLGQMSIIGPRPELLRYTGQYREEELDILKVRPGITDYSSIRFVHLDAIVGENNPDERYETLVLPQKNQLRIRYAHTVSFSTDVKLFLGTIRAVLGKQAGKWNI